jgi:nicotinamide riboside transporter PnuC
MLELPNITLTSFLIAFFIALAISIAQQNYASALGCFLTIATILPIKYMVWKKQKQAENKKHKVIVIKRK